MIFIGKYVGGIFIPNQSYRQSYLQYKRRLEESGMNVSLNIKTSNIGTQSQINFFNLVVRRAVEITGSSYKDIIKYLEPIMPIELRESGFENILPEVMDKQELKDFIEASIIRLNDHFDLDMKVNIINGQASLRT